MRKLSIVLTVLLSVLLAFVACDNSIDIGLDTKVEVKEIRLNETKLDISTGEEATLVATVYPEDATDKSVTWSSSDEDVATVDANGKVTGVGAGEATITVTSNSDNTVYETCSVKVTFDPYKTPLTLEFFKEDGSFSITIVDYDEEIDIPELCYSIDDGPKTKYGTSGTPVSVKKGEVVRLYRYIEGAKSSDPDHFTINCSVDCYVYGNVMSLYSEDYAEATTAVPYAFYKLFYGNTHIKNHDEIDLVLPATQLAKGCYVNMFNGCTGLTRAPELPAKTLAASCYESMFEGCIGLTRAPELPATQLANGCYARMFSGCTSLTTAPVLSAETLADYCYYEMFFGCTSLETAPDLPATQLAVACYHSMFFGCTALTTAPTLPAMTLVNTCYSYMFNGCTNLSSITCLATDNLLASSCTNNWVDGVADSGKFTKHPRGIDWYWKSGSSGIPSTWDKEVYGQDVPLTIEFKAASDNAISITNPASGLEYSINGGERKAYSSTPTISVSEGDQVSFYSDGTGSSQPYPMIINCDSDCVVYGNIMSLINKDNFEDLDSLSSTYVFNSLFKNNTHLQSADGLVLPATTLSNGCYAYMFSGCTSLTTAPSLPATSLVYQCYMGLYYNCSSLTSITCLATNIDALDCLTNWVSGITTTGTFYTQTHPGIWVIGTNVPSGWTIYPNVS